MNNLRPEIKAALERNQGLAPKPSPLQDAGWAAWQLILKNLRMLDASYREARELGKLYETNVFLSDGSIDTETVKTLKAYKAYKAGQNTDTNNAWSI